MTKFNDTPDGNSVKQDVKNNENAKTGALHNDLPPVSPLRRLGSCCYDWLVIIALLIVCWIPVVMFTETVMQIERIPGPVISLYALLVSFAYFAYFWRGNGQTVGMKTWYLKLTSDDGKAVSLKQCMLRYIGAAMAFLPAGLGFWWGYTNDARRCWHDDWSGSSLQRQPKRPKILKRKQT